MNTAAVEQAGRSWLIVQLLRRGIEASVPIVDRGIDLIAFREVGDAGIKALPLQLKCANTENFSLDRKYAGRGVPLVYIWNVFERPRVFILTYDEALETLGDRAQNTASWRDNGKYAVTTVSKELKSKLKIYEDRWEWFHSKLEAQPTSG